MREREVGELALVGSLDRWIVERERTEEAQKRFQRTHFSFGGKTVAPPAASPPSLLPASHIARKHLATTSLARSPQLARLLPCLLGCQRASCPPPLCRLTGLAMHVWTRAMAADADDGRTGFVGGETHHSDHDEDLLVREVETHNLGFAHTGCGPWALVTRSTRRIDQGKGNLLF